MTAQAVLARAGVSEPVAQLRDDLAAHAAAGRSGRLTLSVDLAGGEVTGYVARFRAGPSEEGPPLLPFPTGQKR